MVCGLLVGCGDDDGEGAKVSEQPKGDAKDASPTAEQHDGSTDRNRWPGLELRRLDPAHEPTPFSAKQIALACGPKSKRVFRHDIKGRDATYNCWTFTDNTAEGATFHATECDETGKETGERRSQQATWKELQSHASFPAEQVTTSEAKLKTPAGTFDCMHYVVKRGARKGEAEDRYWFAWDLPGPPIRLERYVNGTLMVTMTLIAVSGVGEE